jgi:mRNA-degrading endonuclease toxin of MazEF toxin-antitoxin module
MVSVNPLHTNLGLAIVCAITTHGGRGKTSANALEVPIPPGLPIKGAVLPYQLRTIDLKSRNATKVCAVPRDTLQATRERLKTLLGIWSPIALRHDGLARKGEPGR